MICKHEPLVFYYKPRTTETPQSAANSMTVFYLPSEIQMIVYSITMSLFEQFAAV